MTRRQWDWNTAWQALAMIGFAVALLAGADLIDMIYTGVTK